MPVPRRMAILPGLPDTRPSDLDDSTERMVACGALFLLGIPGWSVLFPEQAGWQTQCGLCPFLLS